ncbi:MAG TPA: hypothetical protein VN622_15065 [Clostridia bacterium]|nr:hypothetical protein [Clostridia bacterium]
MSALGAAQSAVSEAPQAHAAQSAQAVAVPCVSAVGEQRSACEVSERDKKDAKREFARGLKRQNAGGIREAFSHFEVAAKLNPRSVEYITAREVMRQQLVNEALQRANAADKDGRRVEAMAELRGALELDPENDFVKQRVRDILGASSVQAEQHFDVYGAAAETILTPEPATHNFHFKGSSRELLEQVARAYGLVPTFDDSVASRQVKMELAGVDFATAMSVASRLTKTFWTTLGSKHVLFAADTDQNRRSLQRMSMRTFYVPDASTPQELNDLLNTMRVLFDIRYITPQPASATITLRAPQPTLDAATQFLAGLSDGRPQVLFDIKVFEVSRSLVRQLGVDIPLEFRAFNLPTEAAGLLGNQSVQDIINQLIASGAINQANSTALAALVAQVMNQQNSIFSTPFATFGGGITLMGLTIPGSSLKFSVDNSTVKSLEHVTLRASHMNPAIMRIGTRVPIVNATFAPIFNSAALSQVIQNQSFEAPFPSITYEDIGVNLKATPRVHEQSDVTIDLELQVRAIGTQSLNGVPVISNREYKGTITVRNGEQAIVAGSMSTSEQKTLRGIPALSHVPVANRAVSSENRQESETELLIVLTPHIIRSRESNSSNQITMPR